DFSDCSLEDFHLSALALGRPFGFIEKQGVGETISLAVRETRKFVRTNTNLGIILLLAPLGMAWCRVVKDGTSHYGDKSTLQYLWKKEIGSVLAELTLEDADDVYQAIRLAAPSGMGEVQEHDVAREEAPGITLLEAMKLAAERDMIARQYLNNFQQVFDVGFPTLNRALADGLSLPQAVAHTHLFLLSQYPDSLIARKLGPDLSQEVRKRALTAWEAGGWHSVKGKDYLEKLDRWLRKDGHRLNPGTTADLTAATIFVHVLINDHHVASQKE
ncbi:MAG: triphosphoribosyl-dephospho-CoA synthase, partial [Dehalobacterium sp.]